MHGLPTTLFTTTDATVAVACVVLAMLFGVQPQFARFWCCHPAQRIVQGTLMGLMAFATPIMLVDVPNLHSDAFRPVLFWVMPWVCLAAYLVVVGMGYMRRLAIHLHTRRRAAPPIPKV